jgi:hypothetical protein
MRGIRGIREWHAWCLWVGQRLRRTPPDTRREAMKTKTNVKAGGVDIGPAGDRPRH